MVSLDKIITESINKVSNRLLSESSKGDASSRIAALLNKDKSSSSKSKKKDKEEKTKKNTRRKNIGGGKWITYDYDEYEKNNVKSNEGDKSSIINTIDTELLDLAAAARKVYPDHTDEGAQSQLRKVLRDERPMTKHVERKLNQMIAAGEIPVK